MTTDRIAVVPNVIRWARESAGYSVDLAARRLGTSATTVDKWESGEQPPTIKQLRNASRLYKRPLAVLLLPEPPKDFQPLRDFRRPVDGAHAAWSPELHGEFRRAITQREVFLELAELAPGAVDQPAERLAISESTGFEQAAAAIRAAMRLDERRIQWSNSRAALNACIAAVEELGVLLIQTQGVEPAEMRGFSLSGWPFPVIALNGSDWPRARLFSLFHELTHIAINAGGLCDLHEAHNLRRTRLEDELEQYCNQVAAAALMPVVQMMSDSLITAKPASYNWTVDDLHSLSARYGPSSEAVLLRLITLNLATWQLYAQRKPELDALYEQARQEEKRRRAESTGGPSYYVVKARDLGHGYVASVLDAYQSRAISSLDVADYLYVRYDQLPKLQEAISR